MGWQARASGRSYNSKSGVGSIVSHSTDNIVAYGIRSETVDCAQLKNLLLRLSQNIIVKKRQSSSTAIEPDIGDQLFHKMDSKKPK